MKDQLAQQVRQVEVRDPVALSRRYDYADAFEVRMPDPDPDSPETWVRTGMADTSALVGWMTTRLGVSDAPGTIFGFRIVESGPELVHLEQSLPLLEVVLIGRRVGSSGRMLTSVLSYRRPVLGRLVWAVVGIGHRRAARRLITSRSAGTGSVERRDGVSGLAS